MHDKGRYKTLGRNIKTVKSCTYISTLYKRAIFPLRWTRKDSDLDSGQVKGQTILTSLSHGTVPLIKCLQDIIEYRKIHTDINCHPMAILYDQHLLYDVAS